MLTRLPASTSRLNETAEVSNLRYVRVQMRVHSPRFVVRTAQLEARNPAPVIFDRRFVLTINFNNSAM